MGSRTSPSSPVYGGFTTVGTSSYSYMSFVKPGGPIVTTVTVTTLPSSVTIVGGGFPSSSVGVMTGAVGSTTYVS